MLEDRRLVWRLRQGNPEALCRIYEKYRDDLLRLAVSLSNDTAAAEDVVHDVFTSFIRESRQFRLTGSLRSFLATWRSQARSSVFLPSMVAPDAGM